MNRHWRTLLLIPSLACACFAVATEGVFAEPDEVVQEGNPVPIPPDSITAIDVLGGAVPASQLSQTPENHALVAEVLRRLLEDRQLTADIELSITEVTPDGKLPLRVVNGWAVEYLVLPTIRELEERLDESLVSYMSRLDALIRVPFADQEYLEERIASEFGATLSSVYRPVEPPYYSAASGLVWDGVAQQYLLEVRGISSLEENHCWSALVDPVTAKTVHRNDILCAVE